MNPLGGENTQELENFDRKFQNFIQQTSLTKQTAITAFDNNLYLNNDLPPESAGISINGELPAKDQQHYNRSMVLTPIMINDQVIGIIHVVYTCDKPPIADDLAF